MRIDDLRDELEVIAAGVPASPGDARSAVRGGARRLWLRRGLSGVVALAVIVGAVVSLGHVDGDHHELSITAGSGPAVSEPESPGLTAATIASGKWSTIAPFPLELRSRGTAIWTGSQLIVWGGDNEPRVFGDGAAYDPDTNTWRVLPRAPIAARTMAAAVWTGKEMIVWGGERSFAGAYANDGAAFDPVTWRWRHIAASPLAPRYGAHMLWTGSEVIVVGGSESNSDATTVLDAASYDPAADRWQRIASLPSVVGGVIEDIRPVWTGRDVLAWELWTRTVGTLTTIRIQLVEYDPHTGEWQRGPATDDPHRNVFGPLWTGHEVVVPAAPPLCDLPDGAQNCGPPPTNVHGSVFDPATGAWRSMPQGPADNGADVGVWTGGDLVVLSGGAVEPQTGKTIVAPGSAAAWNIDTNTWTALPRAPIGPVVTAIWTGREILAWGTITDDHTGSVTSQGVRYSAAPSEGAPAVATSKACAASSAVSADVDGDGRPDRVYLRWNGTAARLGVCTSTDAADEVACPGMAQALAVVTLPAQPAVILCGGSSVAELDLAPYIWQGGALRAAALPNADDAAFSSGRGGIGFSNIEQFGCPRIGGRRVMAQLTIEFAGTVSTWTRRAYAFAATGARVVNTSTGTVHGRLSHAPEDSLVPACPEVSRPGTDLRTAP